MSRIAGIISTAAGSGKFLKDALSFMACAPEVPVETRTFEGGALGFAGRESGKIYSDGKVAVVIDGDIYNAGDFPDCGGSDVEIIASLYLEKGFPAALESLNGDFSIALYDSGRKTLFLARDRFGVKPLFYCAKPGFFAFASRAGALLKHPGIYPAPRKKFVAIFAASHYRYFDNDPKLSPFKEIMQVPAASFVSVGGEKSSCRKYWDLRESGDFQESEGALSEKYRELLFDSVRLRLKKADRTAFTLSGGLDSSSVLVSACRILGGKQHAFSSVYPDKTFDESAEIRDILDSSVEEWHQVRIDKPDVFGTVEKMVEANDEPVATATWLSHYLLCKQTAAAGFASLFGGLGGDELNAGEYEYFFYHFADLKKAGREDQLRREVSFWAKYHDHPIYRKNYAVMEKYLSTAVDINIPGRCLPDRNRLTRYFNALNPDYFDLSSFAPIMESPFKSYLKNRAYQDITRETAPCCIRALDRQTSVFGIKNFLPFFDHRLVEFMFRIGGEMKIRDGITKILLRRAMNGILPEKTRTRIKKTGWNAPAHVWFSSESRDQLLDMIRSSAFRSRGIYNVEEVERLAGEHFQIVESGRNQENHMMFFWQLVNLETWLRKCGKG